jgi:hypothetical protein
MLTVLEFDLPGEIAGGDSIRLVVLAKRFNVCVSTCFRWVVKGLPTVNGSRVKLEALKRGKTWLTSEAAAERFFAALPTSAPAPTAPSIRTPSRRERNCARAKKTRRKSMKRYTLTDFLDATNFLAWLNQDGNPPTAIFATWLNEDGSPPTAIVATPVTDPKALDDWYRAYRQALHAEYHKSPLTKQTDDS